MPVITQPVAFFADLDGSPLDNGEVYFGTAGANPVTSPVTVYWDEAQTQPVAQPARTMQGVIHRSGTPAAVYASTALSMLVRNSAGAQIVYAASVPAIDSTLRADLALPSGAGLVGYDADQVYSSGVGAALNGLACASRTALKALNTDALRVAYLTEAGRAGAFVWRTGNYSAEVAADTREGIYIKADAVAASVGAWVRVVADSTWHTDWFGVPDAGASGTGAACDVEVNAMFDIAEVAKPAVIQFGPKLYRFDAAVDSIGYVNEIRGKIGPQSTIIIKKYAEADADRGVFSRTTHGGVFSDLIIQGQAGASGGSALSAKLPTATPAIGTLHFRRITVSAGAFVNQDILIDGTANTTAGTKGYRNIFMDCVTLFGGTGGPTRDALVLRGCQHVFGSNLFMQDRTVITGTSSVESDDIQIDGMFSAVGSDSVFLGTSTANDTITRTTINGYVNGNVVNWGTDTQTTYINARVSGTLNRNWDVTTCGYAYDGSAIEHYQMTVANGADSNFGAQTKIHGMVMVTASNGRSAIFNVQGALNAVSLLAGDAAQWSATFGTASRTNVFYNAGGYYGIQNLSGGSLNYSVTVIGNMTSF